MFDLGEGNITTGHPSSAGTYRASLFGFQRQLLVRIVDQV